MNSVNENKANYFMNKIKEVFRMSNGDNSTVSKTGISQELNDAITKLSERYQRRQVFLEDGRPGDSLTCRDDCQKDKTIKYILEEGEELDEIVWNIARHGRGSGGNAFILDASKGEVKLESNSNLGGRSRVEVTEAYAIKRV